MNVLGIIFANAEDLGDLTAQRTIASLPYGGRYRQVDFALSNLTAAGIRHIGIVSRHHYQSLMNHIGSGEEWGLELEEGGLEFLTPYAMSSTHSYRGKLESLHSAIDFLRFGSDYEYVVLSDTAVIANMDIKAIIDNHIASGKDITIVAKAGVANGAKQLDLAIKTDGNGDIADMAADYVASADYLASMDVFVAGRDWLMNQVREHFARDRYHMDRDLLVGQWNQGKISINVYPYEGIALFNESVEEYYRNSMALIQKEVRHDVFGANHPVYTKVRDRVPTYYGEECAVSDSILADGCVVEGSVKNSVLFRQVTIGAGTQVEDAIIMNDTVVGEKCLLKHVILDKDVVVRPGAQLIGTKNNPIIIKRGEVV